jgi:copper transport protein
MRRTLALRGAGLLIIGLVLGFWPAGPALAHALPVSYDPAPNAVLRSPPAQVSITFSEQLNPDISTIVVVNPSNQRVDNGDVQFSADGLTMTVSLPLLPAGTYVVAWRTHSELDGHVAAGSYIFHIARADGTVPPLSGPLPSGNFPGASGAATTTINGPVILQALAQWVGLVALTVLLGLIFWWWIVTPRQPALSASATAAWQRAFGQAADLALETIIGATIVEVAIQAIILDGTARGLTSWPLISDILFKNRQGIFLVTRVALALAGLLCLWLPRLRTSLRPANLRWVLPAYGLALALVFVYSGHGGAAQQWWGAPIDYLHLLANGVWLGGLFALVVGILPVLARVTAAERRAYLATALPAFGIPALVAVAVLIITGPLNATVRMSAFDQLWTTPYGIVLDIKIALFIVMMSISYVHAFRLCPQLAAQLGMAAPPPADAGPPPTEPLDRLRQQILTFLAPALKPAGGALAIASPAAEPATPASAAATLVERRIPSLIRLEALIGLGVLLCAALLSPLAGTLAPPALAGASFGATGGNQTLTQHADALTVTLSITPGRFGNNTVTVVVKNPDGTYASQGTVFILANMVEMDMGENSFDLQPTSQPGTYQGTVALPMAGHWRLTTVIRTRQDPQHLHRTTFTVSAAF